MKSPKVYFVDPGLVSFLTGIRTVRQFEDGPLAGPLFENYVVSAVLKRETQNGHRPELSFVRTSNGVEVDLVLDRGTAREYIEIKNTATFRPELFKPLRPLKGDLDKGSVLYRGKNREYDKDLQVMNFSDYLRRPDAT